MVDDFLVGFHHAHAGCDVVEHFLCGDAVALVVVGEVGVQVIVEIEFRELQCHLNSVVYAIYNDEVYIVSIWCNRQSRDYLYSSLQEDAKNMIY